MMNAIRRVVVAALLAVWCFPAVSLAKSAPPEPAPISAPMAATTSTAATSEKASTEAEDLATREQKAPELQDFKGGTVIIAGGAAVLLVVLLILLIV